MAHGSRGIGVDCWKVSLTICVSTIDISKYLIVVLLRFKPMIPNANMKLLLLNDIVVGVGLKA